MLRNKPTSYRSSTSSIPIKKQKDDKMMWIVVSIVVVVFIVFFVINQYNSLEDNMVKRLINKVKPLSDIKDMDIVFFMSPKCPWCQKMVQVLKDEDTMKYMEVVDITTEDGQEMAKKYGALDKPVPSFISRKLKTGTIGYKETTKEILNDLQDAAKERDNNSSGDSTKLSDNDMESYKNLEIMMFASPNCGWCNKAKEMLGAVGLLEFTEVVDITTKNGQDALKNHVQNYEGAPTWKSKKTGKISVGFQQIDNLVKELS